MVVAFGVVRPFHLLLLLWELYDGLSQVLAGLDVKDLLPLTFRALKFLGCLHRPSRLFGQDACLLLLECTAFAWAVNVESTTLALLQVSMDPAIGGASKLLQTDQGRHNWELSIV